MCPLQADFAQSVTSPGLMSAAALNAKGRKAAAASEANTFGTSGL